MWVGLYARQRFGPVEAPIISLRSVISQVTVRVIETYRYREKLGTLTSEFGPKFTIE